LLELGTKISKMGNVVPYFGFTWLSAISVYELFVCVTLLVAIMLGLDMVAHDMTQKVSVICMMNNEATLHRQKAKLQG
jgi:hypothetical protein